MSLEARDIAFRYPRRGQRPVLTGVSLTLEPGERLGLSAPSGRGKTTLCKLLAGYERPDRGEILLDGRPLARYKGPCPVQLIGQHPEAMLDPLLPLGESLSEAGGVEARLLEALHIQPGWLTRYPPGALRRGAAALLHRPGPGGPPPGISCATRSPPCWTPITQAQIWDFLLREAAERDLGLLIASHSATLLDGSAAGCGHCERTGPGREKSSPAGGAFFRPAEDPAENPRSGYDPPDHRQRGPEPLAPGPFSASENLE